MDNKNSTQDIDNQDKTRVSGIKQNSQTSTNDLTGTKLNNRYLIEEKIGSGGMSDVYKATDLYLKKADVEDPIVAIKVLQSGINDVSEATQLLIKEAKKTQSLSHPNIISVFDVSFDGKYHYIVMEWLDGEPLDEIIKRAKPMGLPYKGIKKIVGQIADALSYAHKSGIVHTDLKPANIMLTRGGLIKVFDFGVAQALQTQKDAYALDQSVTNSDVSGFTPAYASKEQLNSEASSPSDDLYSYACIVYELLTSKHPYDRKAANDPSLEQFALKKPSNLNFISWVSLKAALALNKKDRIENVKQLHSGLNRNLLPKVTAIAASVALMCGVSYIYLEQNKSIESLQVKLAEQSKDYSDLMSFSKISSSQLLAQYDSFPEDKLIAREALMRQHQHSIIEIYETKIQNVGKDANNKYKNYDEINDILLDAFKYYPDSMRLAQIKQAEETSKKSIIVALSDRLELLLSQGRYHETQNNNIAQLINDLAFLDDDYTFVPTETSYLLFETNFNDAVTKHHVSEIDKLIDVANLTLTNYEGAQPLLSFARDMKTSVKVLAQYNLDLAKNVNTPYPSTAAEVFYLKTFENFKTEVLTAKDHYQLQKIDDNIQAITSQLPNDFKHSIKIKKLVASSYLSYANQLMEKKRFLEAQKLVKKGNKLYEEVNSVSFL